jgi:hypothetical protein
MSGRSGAARRAAWAFALALLASGCSREPMIEVPARMQLAPWPRLGVVEFHGAVDPELAGVATQSFVEMLHAAQPGLRILELGSESHLLAQVGRPELDFEAVRAIAERYQLDALFVGELALGGPKPTVRLGDAFESVAARADVNGQLEARLFEGASGATLWSRSSSASAQVASFGAARGVGPSFGIGDPQEAYLDLARTLAHELRYDFQPSWRRP